MSSIAFAEPVTLGDVVAAALARNPGVRIARAQVDEAQGRRTVASYRFPSNPVIEIGGRSDRLFDNAGEYAFDTGVQQELEVFGQRGLRRDVADADLAAARSGFAATRLAITATVATAYYDLMFRERRITSLTQIVDQATRLEQAGQRRLGAKDISEAEYTLLTADLVAAHADLEKATADRVEAEARLDVLVGRPAGTALATTGDFPSLSPAAPLSTLSAQASSQRPELVVAARTVAARAAEIELRRRERLPNPIVSFAYSLDRSILHGVVTPAGPPDRDQFLGARMAIALPILRGSSGEIAEAQGRYAEAEAERDGIRAAVDEDVTVARARYEQARVQALAYGDLAPKLAATLELYEKGYAAAKLDLAQYLAARDRVLKATVAALEVRRDAAIAAARLARATGGNTEGETR